MWGLIDFSGFDFDLSSLVFHQMRRRGKTASVAEVRKPIHHRSVGRWRAYGKGLAPLTEAPEVKTVGAS